ncbi:MAG: hypothetical protein H7Y31_13850 [Chitinophagaceae bacterium]|nr:hypothetical protein [Chitinophagaceae bacterium]
MSGYLLLRDNKQTGPYTRDEIITKGFKPYDLIWAEGKSAGWRYPGELPEFTAHAPMVEEQPFDRFYKKPAQQRESVTADISSYAPKPAIEKAMEPESEVVEVIPQEKTPEPVKPSRKVFVTLPGGQRPQIAATVQKENGNKEELPRDEKRVNLEPAKEPVVRKEVASTSASIYESYQKTEGFSNANSQNSTYSDRLNIPPAKQRAGSSRYLLGGAIAACLILGGVIIGLLISSNKQSSGRDELQALVKQIQAKQAATKEAVPVPPTSTVQQSISESTLLPVNPVQGQENIGQAVVSKTNPQLVKEESSTIIPTVRQENKETPEPVSSPEKTADPVGNEVSSGQLSNVQIQKLFRLVSVYGSPFKVGVLGGISNLELTVSNNSLHSLNEVEVIVTYLNLDKKIVKTQKLVVNDLPAGEEKIISVPKSNRGVSVSFSVSKLNSTSLDVAHSGL